jgi:hypothetical protein
MNAEQKRQVEEEVGIGAVGVAIVASLIALWIANLLDLVWVLG